MSIATLVILLLLLGVVAWLVMHAWPPTEATRMRNALLLDVGDARDFAWEPGTAPADFRSERRAPDPFFAAVAARVAGADEPDWVRARRIATHLIEHARELGPVRAGPQATYQAIREGYGYCADFVRTFIVLAQASGIGVRQWAFSFDGFGGHGHTFVEVWDSQRAKWLFLDVHNNVHAVDAETGEPLSALEFREFLCARRAAVRIEPLGPGRPGYSDRDKLLAYWRRGVGEWYLWWGNAIQSYYAHPVVRRLVGVSAGVAHAVGIALRLHPRLRVLGEPGNSAQVARMLRLGRRLRAAIAALVVLAIALALSLASRVSR